MNTYQIKTTTITFQVEAEDSDMATVAADEWIQHRGLPIQSQRAGLTLLDDGGNLYLGQFNLAGVTVPGSWGEIRQMKSDLFAAAKQDARENWDLPVIRSRGAVLVVESEAGEILAPAGECCSMPDTLKDFKLTLQTIKRQHPSAHLVWMNIGCDAAECVTDLNEGNYTPLAGEAQAVVYEYPATAQSNAQ